MDSLARAVRACSPEDAAALTRAVADCLTDAEPLIRENAVIFFRGHVDAPGAERVEELVAGGNRDRGVLSLLAARVLQRNRAAIEAARGVALEPGHGDSVAAALVVHDTDWLLAHAEEIVRLTPAAAGPIVVRLFWSGKDYGAVGERLARIVGADPEFERLLAMYVDDAAARDRILAAAKEA